MIHLTVFTAQRVEGERRGTALFAVSVRSTARVGRTTDKLNICRQRLPCNNCSNSTPSIALWLDIPLLASTGCTTCALDI